MILLALSLIAAEPAVTPVFIDKLGPGWQINTWNDTKCEIKAEGSGAALVILFTQPWGGCALDHKDDKLRTVPFAGDAFDTLTFDVDSDDVSLGALAVYLDNGSDRMKVRAHVKGKTARLPLGELNNKGGEYSRIVFFNGGRIGGIAAKIDNIRFESAGERPVAKAGPTRSLSVTLDPKVRHPISPYIYGDNSTKNRAAMRFVRLGGNRWSTYNYTNNASNSGIDFGPHSNDGHLSASSEPARPVIDFVNEVKRRKAAALITVPMLDWVAKDKNGLVAEPAGPGNDRFAPNDLSFQERFVDLVESARNGAPVFYSLDNEPGLWASTHPLVHPRGATYGEMAEKTTQYAAMIKKHAKDAIVFGGVAYGFAELVNLQQAPDARGRDYTEFLLDSWRAAEEKAKKRLVDVFDLHWYTEVKAGRGKILDSQSHAPSDEEAEARMQAPRSLWDPTYDEHTWITKVLQGPVKLLPRLKAKIDAHYKGTQIAITEYNYGGGQHISGAIAEADVLGILGRERVFAANLWAFGYQEQDSYVFAAFDMFLDYDQKGGHVGGQSVQASSSDIASASVYAMADGADDLQLVVINKTKGPLDTVISLGKPGFTSGATYVLSAAGKKPLPGEPIKVEGAKARYVAPPRSITTLVFK